MDKEDKPDLLQSTRRPFKSRDLALSLEVIRQGQRNLAISTKAKQIKKQIIIAFQSLTLLNDRRVRPVKRKISRPGNKWT